VRNLPRVFTLWCPAETRTCDRLIASPTLYRNTTTSPVKHITAYLNLHPILRLPLRLRQTHPHPLHPPHHQISLRHPHPALHLLPHLQILAVITITAPLQWARSCHHQFMLLNAQYHLFRSCCFRIQITGKYFEHLLLQYSLHSVINGIQIYLEATVNLNLNFRN